MAAILSSCEKYRYRLERDIGLLDELVIAYFGVNPSTADALVDDNTVKRWIGFSQLFGASRFIVGNAFGYRSKDVSVLATVNDPVGPDNDQHLKTIIQDADILVPCWGSRHKIPRRLHQRLDDTLRMIQASGKSVMTFGLTASGDPRHPQFLPYKTQLVHLM